MNRQDFQELNVPQLDALPRQVYMRVEIRSGQSFVGPHRHPWAQFLYCSQGVMSVTTETGNYVMAPDMALWIPPGVEHSVEMIQQVNQESLYVDGQVGKRLAGAGKVVEMTPLVRELIREASRFPVEYEESGEQGRLISVLLDQLGHLAVRDVLLPFPRDARLQKICRQLIDDPGCPHSLERWAHRAGASTRTLTRLFEAQTGMGFRAWRQRLRLQRALLLLGGDVSVARVARVVGYTSTSAFIAAFKRYFGTAPGGVGIRHRHLAAEGDVMANRDKALV
jgi:AraC-like DNA-binding protein